MLRFRRARITKHKSHHNKKLYCKSVDGIFRTNTQNDIYKVNNSLLRHQSSVFNFFFILQRFVAFLTVLRYCRVYWGTGRREITGKRFGEGWKNITNKLGFAKYIPVSTSQQHVFQTGELP